MTYTEILQTYKQEQTNLHEVEHAYDEKIGKLRTSIERSQKRLEKLNEKRNKAYIDYWCWGDVIKNLAQELAQHAGGLSYELLGPFGISAEWNIWLYDEEEKKAKKAKDINDLSYIRYSLNGIERHYKDNDYNNPVVTYRTNENLHLYPEGSIADLNGMNYRWKELPTTIEGIFEIMNR